MLLKKDKKEIGTQGAKVVQIVKSKKISIMSNLMRIVEVRSKDSEGNDLMSSDNRRYKVIYFQNEPEQLKDGTPILSNESPSGRTVFETDPNGRMREPLFHSAQKGALVKGKVQTVTTEPYFIPSEYGKQEKDGVRGNFVESYSTPVFENESVYRVALNNGRNPVDPETGETIGSNRGKDISTSKETSYKEESFEETEKKEDDKPF